MSIVPNGKMHLTLVPKMRIPCTGRYSCTRNSALPRDYNDVIETPTGLDVKDCSYCDCTISVMSDWGCYTSGGPEIF